MSKKNNKLFIVGDSAFAEVAYEYFTHDSDYTVAGFAVEKKYLSEKILFGLPVIPLEDIEKTFPPADHDVFVAIVYTNLNRLRTRLLDCIKALGYNLASYISSKADIWHNVKIGEHCFIFENNVLQPFVEIGNNVILWSSNHIGHHSKIENNVFVSSHVVISGFCSIAENSFLGVNSTVSNNVSVGKDCWIGPSTAINKTILTATSTIL